MRNLAGLALAALLLAAPGCGVILGYDVPQPVAVNSNPEGATVYVGGIKQDNPTPCTVAVRPQAPERIEAVLGDMRQSTSIGRRIRTAVVVCDGVFTLGIGVLIDYLTGALYEVTPSVTLNLGKAPPPMPPSPPPSGRGRDPGAGTPQGTDTSGTTRTTNVLEEPETKPCPVCSEPRPVGSATCPHCGME